MISLDQIFKKFKGPDHIFASDLEKILGFRPKNILIFKTAFIHKSMNIKNADGFFINYERLEFLGDSVLGSIVSDHLYFNYPDFKEGELTKLRSKIVNRDTLNYIGHSLKLYTLIKSNHVINKAKDDINGNLLESLIGAIYLDKGFDKCKKFILEKIIYHYINFKTITSSIISYKAVLIEWSQKYKHKVIFKTKKDSGLDPNITFSSTIFIDDSQVAKARELSKKKAEEKAAKRAYLSLNINFTSHE